MIATTGKRWLISAVLAMGLTAFGAGKADAFGWWHGGWGCGWGGWGCGWSCCSPCWSSCYCWDCCCWDCCCDPCWWDCCSPGPVVASSVIAPAIAPAPAIPPVKPPEPPTPPITSPTPAPSPSPAYPGTGSGYPGAEAPAPEPRTTATVGTDRAVLMIRVPEDARVFINGLETKSKGAYRGYFSRNLAPGQKYPYEVVAQVVRNGQTLEDRQVVYLNTGDSRDLAFEFTPKVDMNVASR